MAVVPDSARTGVFKRHLSGRLAMPAAMLFGLMATMIAGCSHRLPDSGSVFEKFVYDTPQAGKPRENQDIRTEYPGVESWGPRISEYRGDDDVKPTTVSADNVASSNGQYQVNFNNAELADVVRVVLLDTLKTGYVLDPNIAGKVTLATPRPLTRNGLLTLLESVLRMNRAVMIAEGGRYKIVPLAATRTGAGGTISYAAERQRYGPSYGITALPLQHVSSAEMIRLLASFATQPGSLKAEGARNLLLIRGTTSERGNLVSIASTFDVDWLRGQSAGIYRLLYATPDEMIAELTEVFKAKVNQPGQGLIRFEPIKRLNAILVLTKNSKLLSEAAEWVGRLDKTSPLSNSLYVYRVEHGKAQRLADLLNKMFSGRGGTTQSAASEVSPSQRTTVVSTTSSTSRTTTPAATQGGGNSARTSGNTDPNSAASNDVSTGDAGERGPVHIVADDLQNKLLIRASLRDYKKVVNILARLDQPAPQVLIKATLAEVQLNRNLRYGVQAFLQNTTPNGVLGFSNGTSLEISPTLPGLNFIVGLPSTPKVILDALSNRTSVRLVSSPSLVVVNSGTAVLQV